MYGAISQGIQKPYSVHDPDGNGAGGGEEVGTGGEDGGIWSNQPRYTITLFYPRARL